jgi:nucleoid DNA-binding protein
MRVHTAELAKRVARHENRHPDVYQEAIEGFLRGVERELREGNEVVLPGFGVFYSITVPGGKGQNLQTGEVMEYGVHTRAMFTPADDFRMAIRSARPTRVTTPHSKETKKKSRGKDEAAK